MNLTATIKDWAGNVLAVIELDPHDFPSGKSGWWGNGSYIAYGKSCNVQAQVMEMFEFPYPPQIVEDDEEE